VTPGPIPAVRRFQKNRQVIEDCLRVGVVPHSTSRSRLDPISIINAAFCSYLTSLPEIIRQFEGAEAENDVAVRSRWTKWLEMWTMKAIDDSHIQRRFNTLKGAAS
jgi:hypothetical protein